MNMTARTTTATFGSAWGATPWPRQRNAPPYNSFTQKNALNIEKREWKWGLQKRSFMPHPYAHTCMAMVRFDLGVPWHKQGRRKWGQHDSVGEAECHWIFFCSIINLMFCAQRTRGIAHGTRIYRPCLVLKKIAKFFRFSVTSNLRAYVWNIKYR